MKLILAISTLAFVSSFAHAAVVGSCKGLDNIGQLTGQTRSLNDLEVAQVSTEEPSGAAEHLLIFSFGDDGYYSCKAINSSADGNGFCAVDVSKIQSSKDSAGDVVMSVPIEKDYNVSTGHCETHETLRIRVKAGYPDPLIMVEK